MMNQTSGETISPWMDTVHLSPHPPLDADATADVCVVGAGIAGMTTAYLLLKEGKTVIVLDDGPVGGGETERTTAHLSNVLGSRYYEFEKLYGEENAKHIAESHTAAINQIEKIVREETIDCAFERLDGYLFVPEGESTDVLQKELQAAHRAGLTDVSLNKESPLPSFNIAPCLRFSQQAQFHPLLYMQGLATAIEKLGGRICNGTHVASVEGGKQATVTTDDGLTVIANDVVVATNAPINDNVTIYSRQAAYRTYVIGLQIPKASVKKALYWDTQDPYHYIRLEDDGLQKNFDVLIVGGEDHKTGQAHDAPLRYHRLEEWARRRFPETGKVLYQWSGQVMETTDGLAFIGRKPLDAENVYIITGDCGNGMTHGTIGGIVIQDLILGRLNAWTDLYDPGRKTIGKIKEFLKENANIAKEMTEWITPGDSKDDGRIALDSGSVVRRGSHKIAIYCDSQGAKHELSAVCPHKGCIVNWNGSEKSWDCPCHGSRFDKYGTVINGPSIQNLKKL